MNKLSIIIVIGTIFTSLTGCGYFTFQGSKYRTGAAHSSSIGSVGLVRTEFNNIYEPQLTPAWKELEIAKVAEYSVTEISEYKISGEAPISNSNQVSGSASKNKSETGTKYIFELKDKDGLLKQINLNSKLKSKLKSDRNWRIVTSIVTIYGHELSNIIEGHTEATWKLSGTKTSGITMTAKAEGKNDIKLKISDGTIVGYQYSRICWGTQNGDAELLLVDRLGADVSCLNGMTHDPSKITITKP